MMMKQSPETSADDNRAPQCADPGGGGRGVGADGIAAAEGTFGRGTRRAATSTDLWRNSRQTTQGRGRGGGADAQGETTEGGGSTTLPLWTLRRSQIRDQQEEERLRTKRLGAAGTRGTRCGRRLVLARTTPASRRPHPQRTMHKDRTGGELFLFTHLLVVKGPVRRCPLLFISPLGLGLRLHIETEVALWRGVVRGKMLRI